MRNLLNSKKGGNPISPAIMVMFGLLTLVILGFILIVVTANLETAGTDALPTTTVSISNQTLESNITNFISATIATIGNCSATCGTITHMNNATGHVINTGNYSQSGCVVTGTGTIYSGFNHSSTWSASYVLSSKSCSVRDMTGNITYGTAGFFANVPTWFSILSVVIIILLIVLIIAALSVIGKKGGGTFTMSEGGGSASDAPDI